MKNETIRKTGNTEQMFETTGITQQFRKLSRNVCSKKLFVDISRLDCTIRGVSRSRPQKQRQTTINSALLCSQYLPIGLGSSPNKINKENKDNCAEAKAK